MKVKLVWDLCYLVNKASAQCVRNKETCRQDVCIFRFFLCKYLNSLTLPWSYVNKHPTDLHWVITHWSRNCGLIPCVWLQGWSYRRSHGWDLLGILALCYSGSMFCLSRRALAKPHYCSSCLKYTSWMSCLTLPRQNGVFNEAKLKILKTLPSKKHKYTSFIIPSTGKFIKLSEGNVRNNRRKSFLSTGSSLNLLLHYLTERCTFSVSKWHMGKHWALTLAQPACAHSTTCCYLAPHQMPEFSCLAPVLCVQPALLHASTSPSAARQAGSAVERLVSEPRCCGSTEGWGVGWCCSGMLLLLCSLPHSAALRLTGQL